MNKLAIELTTMSNVEVVEDDSEMFGNSKLHELTVRTCCKKALQESTLDELANELVHSVSEL